MMADSKYVLLPQQQPGAEEQDPKTHNGHCRHIWRNRVIGVVLAIFSLSFTLNIVLIHKHYFNPELVNQLQSKFAHLQKDAPTEIVHYTEYDSLNRTVQDAAWNHPDLEPWTNFVALDGDYTIANGLSHSQRWPWDTTKGVYILTAAHELHCVRIFRTSLNEYHDGVPEPEHTWPYAHVLHCLNVLRDSVMCNADDTPMYIGRLHKQIHEADPRAGIGDMKMCRDWSRLLAWSKERSACYRPIKWGEPGVNEIERYFYCPDGARPWETQA